MLNTTEEGIAMEDGITGYWVEANKSCRCSVCYCKQGRVLRLLFGETEARVCAACGTALRRYI